MTLKALNINMQPVSDSNNKKTFTRLLAIIDEINCIGCNRCSRACPVNAIVGAPRTTHTIMADICTGCSLCVHSCPTQCISIQSTKVIVNIRE